MKNRIKELRLEKNMLQLDVGILINKSQRMVGFYESGYRDPNTETLAKLAGIFDCSIDYLLCQTEIRNTLKVCDMDIAFATGIQGLNEENQKTLKKIMEGLLSKQNEDYKNNIKNKNGKNK